MKRSIVRAAVVAVALIQFLAPFGSGVRAQLSDNGYTGTLYPFSITWSNDWTVEDQPSTDGGTESFSLQDGPCLVIFQATDSPGSTSRFLAAIKATITGDQTVSNPGPVNDSNGDPIKMTSAERSYEAIRYDQEIDGTSYQVGAMLDVWQITAGESVLAIVEFCDEQDFVNDLPNYIDLVKNLHVGADAVTPTPTAPPEPAASPTTLTQSAAVPQVFLSSKWRITVVGARQSAAINSVGLKRRDGKEWVVVVADISNWSSKVGRISPDELVLLQGDGTEVAVDATSTASVAETLKLDISDTTQPVRLAANVTKRFVLVYLVDEGASDFSLARGKNTLPLESTLLNSLDLNDLPDVEKAPALVKADVDSVESGSTIAVFSENDQRDHVVKLIGVDVPDCNADQAMAALEKQAGDTVFLEEELGATSEREIDRYVWIEKSNGTRTLLDQSMILTGNAHHAANDTGRYSTWLIESESEAQAAGAGLWTACATPTVEPTATATETPQATETPAETPTAEATSVASPAASPVSLEVQWTFRGNAARTGELPGPGLGEPATFPWIFRVGSPVISSPAVANGVVYVGSDNSNLYALDSFSGPAKWIYKAEGPIESSPAIAGGTVYFGSDDHNLYAVNADTGKERWKFETGNTISSSPAVAGGVVYFQSDDGNIYGLDAATSEQLWKTFVGQASFSSPAIVGSTVYAAGGRDLVALDAATGKQIWQFDLQGFVASSPAIVDRVVFIGNASGDVFAIDAATGDQKWQFQAQDGVIASPAVAGGMVYFGSLDKNVYALDAETGHEVWNFAAGDQIVSSPIVSDGVVYAASFDTYLYGLDAKTGDERTRIQVGITLASPVMVNGVIYTASADGNVQARRPFDLFGIGGTAPATPVPVPSKTPESEQIVAIQMGPGKVFTPSEVTINSDTPATIVLENQDSVPHTFVIDELDVHEAVDPGEITTVQISPDPGTYTFYCELPGLREAGMEGTLKVE
ncbi:MAG: PQQ-binding-like beta-propeller repeat protein [Thermomicrobiales bacterium]